MEKKIYLLGGGRCASNADESGLYLYDYDEKTGGLTRISRSFSEVSVGQQCFDNDRMISYVAEEIDSQFGEVGGGGYIRSFRFDPETMSFSKLNARPSLGSMPAYICIDKSKRYALVVHHCLPHHVTRLVKNEDGSFGTEVIFEEGSVILFRLNEDGSFGEACDAMSFPGDKKPGIRTFCHLHWVGAAPGGELYIVTDCGSDRIFTFKINREEGKLVLLNETVAGYGYWPRYGVFHPELPVFYDTNEQLPIVQGYRYDTESGALEKICEVSMLDEGFEVEPGVHASPSDIVIHPSGRYVYGAVRGCNRLAVFAAGEDGTLKRIQSLDCGGKNPRGICITPDGKYLYSLNCSTPVVEGFRVEDDGRLTDIGAVNSDCIATMVPVLI